MVRIKATVNIPIVYSDPNRDTYDPEYANKRIADMLRYDSGKVISVERHLTYVVFTINCKRYTASRWRNFKIKTEVLEV